MSNSGFVWVRSPDALAQDIVDYANRVEAALYAAANAWGQQIQDLARENASWTDRTANARSGLFFAVEGYGMGEMRGDVSAEAKALMQDIEIVSAQNDEIIIVLGHTVYYGKYLELSHGGSYAIIMSTIEENLPDLERLIRKAYAA